MEEQEQIEQQPQQDEPGKTTERDPAEAGAHHTLAAKLAEAEKQIEQYRDLLLRKAAEFDNYKKRVEGDGITMARFAKVDLLTELLPVVDDFHRSMKLVRESKDAGAVARGIELIQQKLMKFLESQGVNAMETVGKEFDVRYHDALLQVQRDDVPPHTIVEEVEKGYFLGDRVIRHAKVVVSTSPTGDSVEPVPTPSSGDEKNQPEGN